MHIIRKPIIGMEVSHNGIGAVLPQALNGKTLLKRAGWSPLASTTLRQTMREPQVQNREDFVRAVREAWGSLQQRHLRVILSLPDSAGRLLLTTLDSDWKRQEEAAAMLRWKLGKQLGMEPDDLQLDFQVVRRHENGSSDILAAVACKAVVVQYEELFLEAGLQPFKIGFHTMNLLRLFAHYPSGKGHLALLYDNCLAVVALSEGRPLFCRTKAIPDLYQQSVLRRELVSSFTACRQACSGSLPGSPYGMVPPDELQLWELLQETCGEETHRLQSSAVLKLDPACSFDQTRLHCLSAAVGAVLGDIRCPAA